MLARGYEVQAYVVAAAYSMRLMFENAQENGWTEPDLFNRIAYWSGFSHTLALGVLDARNLYGPSALEEVLHPHPHVRQEFIYRAAVAELARSDLASLYGESAPEQLARFASRYLSGLNLAVNSAFWACCVISGLHETDLYPAFALRKTADWKLNKMGHDYSCLVIAEVDSRVFQSPTTYYCFLNALAGDADELSFPEKDLGRFLASELVPRFGKPLMQALDSVGSLLNEGFIQNQSIDEGFGDMELVLIDPSNLNEVIRLPDEVPGSGPRPKTPRSD